MKVIGETILFKNDFGFSTSLANKNADGSYDHMYISVQFKKDDVEAQKIPNKTKINIKNGFLSFYKATNGTAKPKLIITEYEIIDENKAQSEDDDYQDPFANVDVTETVVDDDDLPF